MTLKIEHVIWLILPVIQLGGLDFNLLRSHKGNKKNYKSDKKKKKAQEKNASWWFFVIYGNSSIQISFPITETVHTENVHIWEM